jgi:hypothetical protein
MLVSADVVGELGDALSFAFGMFWEILWALILGFALSAVVPRSGKFGMPCERTQSAYLTACGTPCDAEPEWLLEEDPHAARRIAQLRAASATVRRVWVWGVGAMSRGEPSRCKEARGRHHATRLGRFCRAEKIQSSGPFQDQPGVSSFRRRQRNAGRGKGTRPESSAQADSR